MAISRPFLLVLLAVALLGATVVAVQSTSSGSGDSSTPAASSQTPASSAPTAAASKPAALSPKDALRSAFSFGELKSARFEGSFSADLKDQDSGSVDLSGSFQQSGPRDMPKVDVSLSSKGFGDDAQFGFVSTGDKAYVVADGTGYQLPEEAWSQAVEARATQSDATPMAALGKLDAAALVERVSDEGSEQLDGVETQHVSATIDVDGAVRELGRLAGARPEQLAGASDEIERAQLDVWVGKDDRIARKIEAEISGQGNAIRLQLQLSEVNDPQTIEAPAKVSDVLPANVLGGVTPAFSSGLSLATGADRAALELPTNNKPQRLDRAVAQHRMALILFTQPRGLDDRVTAAAVRDVAGKTKALVLTDDVRNTKRYGKLVEDLGVSQAPAVVIVDRDGKAHLIEGFVDRETLVQELSDAR
jgi:hypothetical protein